MMRVLSLGLFGALATGLHLGAFHLAAPEGGVQSGGDQGADQRSVTGAAPQMQALVERWQQKPDVVDVTPTPIVQPTAQAPAVTALQAQNAPAALPSLPQMKRLDPLEDSAVDTTTVAPPPKPKPAPKPEVATPAPEPAKPAPKTARAPAQTTTQPAPAKKAAGSGTTARPKAGTTTAARQPSNAQSAALTAKWGAQVRRRISRNLRCPKGLGATGKARVALSLAPNGRLKGLQLARSSGNAAMDQAALKAVERAGRFAKAPKGLTKSSYGFGINLQCR